MATPAGTVVVIKDIHSNNEVKARDRTRRLLLYERRKEGERGKGRRSPSVEYEAMEGSRKE